MLPSSYATELADLAQAFAAIVRCGGQIPAHHASQRLSPPRAGARSPARLDAALTTIAERTRCGRDPKRRPSGHQIHALERGAGSMGSARPSALHGRSLAERRHVGGAPGSLLQSERLRAARGARRGEARCRYECRGPGCGRNAHPPPGTAPAGPGGDGAQEWNATSANQSLSTYSGRQLMTRFTGCLGIRVCSSDRACSDSRRPRAVTRCCRVQIKAGLDRSSRRAATHRPPAPRW